MDSRIENVINGFNLQRKSGLLLFWKNTTPGNGWYLTLTGQPWQLNREHEALQNYRNNCLSYGDVGPGTWRQRECFAGQVAHEMRPQPRPKEDNQILGQFAVPVFNDRILVGVIELVTLEPKEDYEPDLKQLRRLLKAVNLRT